MIMKDHFFFFFKQKTAYEMRISDWSSDVCSSDLEIDLVEVHRCRERGDRVPHRANGVAARGFRLQRFTATQQRQFVFARPPSAQVDALVPAQPFALGLIPGGVCPAVLLSPAPFPYPCCARPPPAHDCKRVW